MKQIHATTTYTRTYARMLLLFAISAVATFTVPPLSESDFQSFLQTHIVNGGLLYAILTGFLLYITLSRKQGIEEAVSLELNKSRRIYHLALHMKKADPQLGPWFRDLKKSLEAYHAHFRKIDFKQYESGNALFRKVTYAVYGLPARRRKYNEALYGFLLDAAASASEAREIINDKIESYLGRFSWIVMAVITVVFSAVVLRATPAVLETRIISTFVVFSLLLSLQLLYEYDRSNIIKQRFIAALYAENMERAER